VYAAEGEAAERDLVAATDRLTRQASQLSEARNQKTEAARKLQDARKKAQGLAVAVATLEQDKRNLLLDKERLHNVVKHEKKAKQEARVEAEELRHARAHFETQVRKEFP
jgi:hypothetical protein